MLFILHLFRLRLPDTLHNFLIYIPLISGLTQFGWMHARMLLKMYRYHNMVQGLETGVLTVNSQVTVHSTFSSQ